MILHVPVLKSQVESYWVTYPDGVYWDATVGGGGHSLDLLKRLGESGQLLCTDWDPTMLELSKGVISDRRAHFVRANFGEMIRAFKVPVSGILVDLGYSLDQMSDPGRGLSFEREGPLDMRINPSGKESLEIFIKKMTPEKLAVVLEEFGGISRSNELADRIYHHYREGKLKTTLDLARLCGRRTGKRHPATQVFQSLRIAVNREIQNLQNFLEAAPGIMKEGGRLLVISFHSLEDRVVKHTFRRWKKEGVMKVLTAKPIRPDRQEILANPRARSARLRVAERV